MFVVTALSYVLFTVSQKHCGERLLGVRAVRLLAHKETSLSLMQLVSSQLKSFTCVQSIFVGCTMPNFDRTERCTSLTPRQSTPEAAFQLPLELLPEDISEDLSDLSAPTIDLAGVREPDPPESRRERSAAKRSSNKVDLDELDFVPHHTKRSRHGETPPPPPPLRPPAHARPQVGAELTLVKVAC